MAGLACLHAAAACGGQTASLDDESPADSSMSGAGASTASGGRDGRPPEGDGGAQGGAEPGGTGGGAGTGGAEPGDQCRLYVSAATGSDANSGTSWDAALANVTVALDLAEGQSCGIWVAAGTYYPDASGPWQDGNQALTFQLRNGVELYGGFVGDEVRRDERDPLANETILSGDLEEDDDAADPSTFERNSLHVVTGANDAVLDGFVITAGVAGTMTAVFPEDSELYHGAGLINRGTSPTVRNCTFRSNLAYDRGGGVYNMDYAKPSFVDCTFEDNHASVGGAIANATQAAPLIQNCEFLNNEADLAGAIDNQSGASPEIRDSTFQGNYYRAVSNRLGAQTTIVDSTFIANQGGILSEDSTVHVSGSSFVDNTQSAVINVNTNGEYTDCSFEGNSTTSQGGAVVNGSGNLYFTGCRFSNNSATGDGGGAMWNEGVYSWATVTGCEFRSNDGGAAAGAIGADEGALVRVENSLFSDNRADYGGALHVKNGVAVVTNATFYLNEAAAAGDAIYVHPEGGEASLRNSIVWVDDFAGAVLVTQSNTSQSVGAEDPTNLHVDPNFALGDLGLRLEAGSPCIDAGDTALLPADAVDVDDDLDFLEVTPFDVAGNPRVSGARVDLGAYEYQAP
jgi:hypothetical protein